MEEVNVDYKQQTWKVHTKGFKPHKPCCLNYCDWSKCVYQWAIALSELVCLFLMKRKNLVLSIQLLPSAASLRALACVPGRLFRDRDKKAAKTRAKRRRRSFACVFPIFCLAKQTDTATNEGLACEPSLFNLFTVVNFICHLSWLNNFFVSLPTNTVPHYINNIFFQT